MEDKVKSTDVTVPRPGQVIIVLDGQQHPMFILPAEAQIDDTRPLTAAETKELTAIKGTLMKHVDAVQEFAQAIYTAHTGRLYRGSHSTLGAFLLTYVAFRPVTFEQFLAGKVPAELTAFKPHRSMYEKSPNKASKKEN